MQAGLKKTIGKSLPYVPYILLFIAMVFVNQMVTMYGGDDLITRDLIRKMSFPEFISNYYLHWSGRLSILAAQYVLIGQDNVLWRYMNSAAIALFAFTLARLALGRNMHGMEQKKLLSYNILACLGFGYFYFNVISASVFWVTGSICYLWATTAGLWAMTTYRDSLAGQYKFNILQTIIVFLCVIFACWGQEQIALVMLVLAGIAVVHLFIKNKKVEPVLLIQLGLILVVTVVCLTAPGTRERYFAEIAKSNPDFLKVPVWDRIGGGVRWLFHTIILDCKLILIPLWGMMTAQLLVKFKGTKKAWLAAIPALGVLLLSLTFVSLKNLAVPFARFDIDYILNESLLVFHKSWLTVGFWGILLLMTPVLIWQLFGKSMKTFYLIILLAAAVCATGIMIFSPSMYPTGHRAQFTMSALLILVTGFFIKDPEKYPGLIVLASIVPALQIVTFVINWLSGFYVWY